MNFGKILTQIVGKNNTPVHVTDDNALKVSGTVTLGSGGQTRTPDFTRVVNDTGTVAIGARSVTFFNAGSDDCTVLTETLAAGESVTFSAGGEDDTLTAIAYTANTSAATTLLIAEVR